MKEKEKAPANSLIPLNDYVKILETYDCRRYSKLSSVIRLQSANLPTLPGFVISEINDQVVEQIAAWLAETDSKRLSLRFDSPNPDDNKRLTLSNPSLSEFSAMRELLKPPILGMVLAENDRFNQDHSVLTQFFDDHIRCEIVGPGFDAADLTRGHTSPHEVYEFYSKANCDSCSELTPQDIMSHQITGQSYYQSSRMARMGVIHGVLEKGLGRNVLVKELDFGQIERVEDFLFGRGAEVPYTYQPIGYDRLQSIYKYICELDSFRSYYKKEFGIDVSDRVLSSSFLKKHGLVFWDVYGAEKYNKR